MPAMPIARQQRADRRRDQRDQQRDQRRHRDVGAGELGERPQRHDDDQEDQRQPGEQDAERDLVRRLAPRGALDERDHAVEEDSARLLGDLDHDPVGEHARAAGDRGAVAAGLADHRRRLAGDRRLVDGGDALDHGAVARDHLAGLDDDDVAARQLGRGLRRRRRAAARSSRCASRAALAACARPRPSASASARLAKTTVSHSQTATVKVNQPARRRRLGLAAEELISHATVVMTAPISTTNITGLRTCTRGSSLRSEATSGGHQDRAVEQRPRAAFDAVALGAAGDLRWRSSVEGQVELEDVDAGLAEHAEEAPVGVVVDRAAGPARAGGRGPRATRCAWIAALASEMCGSTPEPELVTASTGTRAGVSARL